MKAWMATAAALTLLAGISAANAQNAPAGTNDKSDKAMEQSAAPKAEAKSEESKTKMRHSSAKTEKAGRKASMGTRSTTGTGAIGGPRNDPSIHQSSGDRDSRDYPKSH
jgi:uncharacterized low-complexity protein